MSARMNPVAALAREIEEQEYELFLRLKREFELSDSQANWLLGTLPVRGMSALETNHEVIIKALTENIPDAPPQSLGTRVLLAHMLEVEAYNSRIGPGFLHYPADPIDNEEVFRVQGSMKT